MPCKNHPLSEDRLTGCRAAPKRLPGFIVEIGRLPTARAAETRVDADLSLGSSRPGVDMATVGAVFVALLVDGLIVMIPILVVVCRPRSPRDRRGWRELDSAVIGNLFVSLFAAWLRALRGADVRLGRAGRVSKKAMSIRSLTAEGNELPAARPGRGRCSGRSSDRTLPRPDQLPRCLRPGADLPSRHDGEDPGRQLGMMRWPW